MWIIRTVLAVSWLPITIYDFSSGNTSAGISDIVVIFLLAELTVRDYIDKEAK